VKALRICGAGGFFLCGRFLGADQISKPGHEAVWKGFFGEKIGRITSIIPIRAEGRSRVLYTPTKRNKNRT